MHTQSDVSMIPPMVSSYRDNASTNLWSDVLGPELSGMSTSIFNLKCTNMKNQVVLDVPIALLETKESVSQEGGQTASVPAFLMLTLTTDTFTKNALFFGCDIDGNNIYRLFDTSVVNTWTVNKNKFYVTRHNDTVKSIASMFGISHTFIIENNHITYKMKKSDLFAKGKILRISDVS